MSIIFTRSSIVMSHRASLSLIGRGQFRNRHETHAL